MNMQKALTAHGLALAVMTYAGSSHALGNPQAMLSLGVQPLSARLLDQQRGGFIDKDGFKVQIGLQKMTLVDGMVVAKSSLVIPDIDPRKTIDQAMADMDRAMDSMDQTMADLDDTMDKMDQSLEELDRQMASNIEAVKETLKSPSILTEKGLTAEEQDIAGNVSSVLEQIQNVPRQVASKASEASAAAHDFTDRALDGTGVDVNSTTSASQTLSQVASTQVSIPQARVDKVAEKAIDSASIATASAQNPVGTRASESLQTSVQNSSLPSSMVFDQALTQVFQTDNATVIQNAADNRLIQTFQVMNIELSNLTQLRATGIQSRLLPQMIFYSR